MASLFAGGRIGGVRLSGRKPGGHERSLHRGRRAQALKARTAPVRILESGASFGGGDAAAAAVSTATAAATAAATAVSATATATAATAVSGGAFGVAATQASSAQLLRRPVRQPPLPYSSLPTPGLHDSLQ